MTMQRRALGRNGPAVSAIGIGAMSFAGVYGSTTEAEAHAILDEALELGVDHVDTSNVYGMGRSEEMIGSYLARYRSGRGLPFRIATKGGITRDPQTGARRFDNTRAHLQAELDGSLRRLGVERVDLYYVHRRDPEIGIEEVTETLAGFVKAGKIGAIGYSEIAPTSLRRAAAVHPVAAVQSEYSLATRLPELGLTQACAELGTALVAFSPVGRGLLTDTPPDAARVAASPFLETNPRFAGGNLACNVAASDPLRRIAREAGMPAAALAIGWLLARSPAAIPIPGTRSAAHLRELAAGVTTPPDAATLAALDAAMPPGWAHGARYNADQSVGPENYC